jgi:hypothetical protein
MKTLQNKILTSICAVSLLFAFSSSAYSQEGEHNRESQNGNSDYRPRIEIGVRVMPVFNSFRMQTYAGTEVRGVGILGYGIGALLGYNFNRHLEMQAEVIYSSVSRKYSEGDVDRMVNLRYVSVPFLLSLNSGKFSAVNLNIVAGPQLGIMVGNTVYTSGNVTPETPVAVLTVRKSDIGLAYGAGLDFKLNHAGTFRVGAGFRGVYGLLNISKTSQTKQDPEYYVLENAHVQTYSVYGGFSFIF